MNKRGIEMAISTIVVLVISVVLLLFLILALTFGSESFISIIKQYVGYSNVDSVVSSCNLLAESNSLYSYCCEEKTVKYYEDGKKVESMFTCKEVKELDLGSVFNLDCRTISCGRENNEEQCNAAGGKWNSCGSICGIMNQGKNDVLCPAVCDPICTCAGLAGFDCPQGYSCKIPEGIADALGYCKKE